MTLYDSSPNLYYVNMRSFSGMPSIYSDIQSVKWCVSVYHPWWRNNMVSLYALLPFVTENPSETTELLSQRARDTRLWRFLCKLSKLLSKKWIYRWFEPP